MKVSFKITAWEEVYVSDADWPKIKEALENGTVYSSNSLYSKFAASDYQVVPECEEQLTPELMEFHQSWDWLMPVVNKIEGLGYRFEISSARSCPTRGYGVVAFTLPKGQISFVWKPEITEEQATIGNWATTQINATYLAVVEFISWYNKNK